MLEVLYDPDRFFKNLRDGWIVPIVIVALNGFVSAMISYQAVPTIAENLAKNMHVQRELLITMLRIQAIVMSFLGAFIGWIIMTAIVHGLSALFNGSGDFTRTLRFTAYAYLPSIIITPVKGLYASFPPRIESYVLGLAENLWQAYIMVFALKYARNIETSKAVICVAIPYLASYLISVGLITFYGVIR